MTFSVIMFNTARRWKQENFRLGFERISEDLFFSVKKTVENTQGALDALYSLFNTVNNVTRGEFHDFTTNLLSRYPGLYALEWLPRIPHSQRLNYKAQAHQDGFPQFMITELKTQGIMVRADRRDEYFPVYYIEPRQGNEAALGFDLGSDPIRSSALQQSRDYNQKVATARVTLVQEKEAQFGFLIVQPLYRKDIPLNSVEARRENLKGFLLGVYRIGDMVDISVSHLHSLGIDIALFDQSAPPDERFLYHYSSLKQPVSTEPQAEISELQSGLHYERIMDVAGRKWLFLSIPNPAYRTVEKGFAPWWILVGGFFVTFLLSAYVLLIQQRNEKTKQYAEATLQAKSALENEIDERKRVEANLLRSNRAIKVLFECAKVMVHTMEEDQLLDQLCHIITESGGYRLVWVGYAQEDENKSVRPVMQCGFEDGYLAAVNISWGDTEQGGGPTGMAIRNGRPSVIRNIMTDPAYAPWRDEAGQRGYASSLALPLTAGGAPFGALNIYAEEADAFDKEELQLLQKLADDMAYGIMTLRARAERKQVEERLRRSHQVFEFLAHYNELTSGMKFGDISHATLEFLRENLGIEESSITLYNPRQNGFYLLDAHHPKGTNLQPGDFLPAHTTFLSEIVKQRQPFYRPDIAAAPSEFLVDKKLFQYGLRSDFMVPLWVENSCLGSLNVGSQERDGFSESTRQLITVLAPRLAQALQNANLFEELRQSEAQVRLLLDSTGESIFGMDIAGNFTFANRSCLKLLGYKDSAALIGKNAHSLIHHTNADGSVYPEDQCPMHKAQKKGQAIHVNSDLLWNAGGSSFLTEYWSYPIIRDDIIIGSVVTFIDITERNQAEEHLLLLSTAIEQSSEGLAVADLGENLLLLNNAFATMHGFLQEELAGRPFAHCFPSGQLQEVEKAHQQLLETGEFFGELKHARRDGTVFPGQMHNSLIRDKTGNPIGIVITLRDITEQKKMETELLKAQKLESLGILAGGIAHDFNNLLTTMLGNINLVKLLGELKKKPFARLTETEKALARAQDLAQQLLTFSKGGEPVKKPLAIKQLIQDTARFALRGTSAVYEFKIPPDLWSVVADEGQISQVINNMVINAVQAMSSAGVITISCENIFLSSADALPLKDGHYVKIAIMDQGSGIAEENLSKIFDPYFTTKSKGSGLGLATAYSIVKKHQGHISVESESGAGATFHIYLPASEQKVVAKEEKAALPLTGKGWILVMDDDEAIRTVAAAMLKELGYDVELAEDGIETIAFYQKRKDSEAPFSLIIMDLTIPGGMGGIETIGKLKEIDEDVKAVVSSGYSNDPIMADYKQYGFVGVITKPYSLMELSTVVHDALT